MTAHNFQAGDRVRLADTGESGVIEMQGLDGGYYIRRDDGNLNFYKGGFFLVAPTATPFPIKTVKKIVPGTYGRVVVAHVGGRFVDLSLGHGGCVFEARELREAARIFGELADALEDQGSDQ